MAYHMEVVLIAQNFSCKYKDSFTNQPITNKRTRRPKPVPKSAAGQWQFIIKIARVRRKSAYAFEAKNMQGDIMFCGVTIAQQDLLMGPRKKMVEAALKAKHHGFQRILILSSSRSLIQVMNKEKNPRLQEKTMMADISFFQQNGLTSKLFLVPKVVIDQVWSVAYMATRLPIHQCWHNPTIL